jgi:hypothetical protein
VGHHLGPPSLYAVPAPSAAKGRAHLTENMALKHGIDAATAAMSETVLKSTREV